MFFHSLDESLSTNLQAFDSVFLHCVYQGISKKMLVNNPVSQQGM